MKEIIRKILKAIFKVVAIMLYRPKIVGKENIPQNTAAIICPNHVHALDSAVIVVMSKRKVNVLAKEELFINGFVRWVASVFGIYPVKKGKKSLESMKVSLKLLKNNELLMIFPEGTRKGLAKGVKPKNGAIKLAIRSGVPIIPVGVQGNFKLFRKIKLNIGKPIDYNKFNKEANNKEILDNLTKELMDEIVKLREDNI